MAAKIKIKRSANTTAPTTLAQGELAYSYKTGVNKLYLGTGQENNGNASSHDVIGGKYFTDLLTVTAGTTTAEKALIPDANKKLDTLKLGHITISLNDIVVDDGSTTNLDIDLVPKGEGTVKVPTGYKDRTGFGASSLATKEYVDATASGLDVKESVRVASVANINLSNPGTATFDGVNLVSGDRILVKDQSTGNEKFNGIYIFNGSSSAMTRAEDFDDSAEVTAGAFTFVEEGSVNSDSGFVLSTNGAITIDTTALAFTQFSGAGAVTAGAGLSQSGTTIAVDFDNTTIGLDTSSKLAVKGGGTQYQVLLAGAGTATPSWGALPLAQANATSGQLPATAGGTGLGSSTIPKGSILHTTADNTFEALDGGGAADQVLTYDSGNDVVEWSSVLSVGLGGTGLNTVAQGSILVANSANTLTALSGSGTASDKLLKYNTSGNSISWITSIGVGFGGTGLTSYTQGDLIYASASSTISTLSASGHAGKFLVMNGTATAPEWTDTIDGGPF